jgi:hypothetical protein
MPGPFDDGGLPPQPPDPPKLIGHYTPYQAPPPRFVPQALIHLQTEGFRGALHSGLQPDEMAIDIIHDLVARSELAPLLYESVFFYDVDTLRALLGVDDRGTNRYARSNAEVYIAFANVLSERPVAVCGQTANALAEIILGPADGAKLVTAANRVHADRAIGAETDPARAGRNAAMLAAAHRGYRRALFVCSLGPSHRFVLVRSPSGQVDILQGWFDNAAIRATGYALATWLDPANVAKYRRAHADLANDLTLALQGDLQASMRVFKPAGTTLQDNDFDITGLRFTFAVFPLEGGKLRAGLTRHHIARLTSLFQNG